MCLVTFLFVFRWSRGVCKDNQGCCIALHCKKTKTFLQTSSWIWLLVFDLLRGNFLQRAEQKQPVHSMHSAHRKPARPSHLYAFKQSDLLSLSSLKWRQQQLWMAKRTASPRSRVVVKGTLRSSDHISGSSHPPSPIWGFVRCQQTSSHPDRPLRFVLQPAWAAQLQASYDGARAAKCCIIKFSPLKTWTPWAGGSEGSILFQMPEWSQKCRIQKMCCSG